MNLQRARDEIEDAASDAWMRITAAEHREIRSQARLAAGYALAAVVLGFIAFEHGRRAHGATRGRWQAGRWTA